MIKPKNNILLLYLSLCCLYTVISIDYNIFSNGNQQRLSTETGRDTHRRAGAHWQALSTKDQRPRPSKKFRAFRSVAIMQKDGTLIQRAKVADFK
jgi:hypothetical protein